MHRTLRFEHTVLLCFLKISCSYFLTNTMEQSPSRETLLGSPRIYGTRIFITKSQRCASWSYSMPDESSSFPVLLRPILISSSYNRQVLPSGLLLWSFATNPVCMSILPLSRYQTPCQSHPPWFGDLNNILLGVPFMKPFIVQFPSASCCFLPLWLKYLSQHPLREYPPPLMREFEFCIQTKQQVKLWVFVFRSSSFG